MARSIASRSRRSTSTSRRSDFRRNADSKRPSTLATDRALAPLRDEDMPISVAAMNQSQPTRAAHRSSFHARLGEVATDSRATSHRMEVARGARRAHSREEHCPADSRGRAADRDLRRVGFGDGARVSPTFHCGCGDCGNPCGPRRARGAAVGCRPTNRRVPRITTHETGGGASKPE